jgi:hypothetical protein
MLRAADGDTPSLPNKIYLARYTHACLAKNNASPSRLERGT